MKPTIKTTYVSRETGEILTRLHVQKKYTKIKCNKTIKKFGYRTEIHYLWECKINNQLTLKL